YYLRGRVGRRARVRESREFRPEDVGMTPGAEPEPVPADGAGPEEAVEEPVEAPEEDTAAADEGPAPEAEVPEAEAEVEAPAEVEAEASEEEPPAEAEEAQP